MKKILICIVMSLALITLGACGNKGTATDTTDETTNAADAGDTADAAEETDTTGTTAADAAGSTGEYTGETQEIGSDTLGYMAVPADWVQYEGEGSATSLQYASEDSRVIVSMDVIDKSVFSQEEQDKLTAETAAQSIWTTLDQGGVKQIKGAKVQLAGYDAFQVYGAYTQGADDTSGIIINWVFESEDGTIHVVSAEGATETVMTGVTQIESTYKLTK